MSIFSRPPATPDQGPGRATPVGGDTGGPTVFIGSSGTAPARADWPADDAVLLDFGASRDNVWKLRDAFQGTQVFGGTGSGKTSGSGKALAHAFLKANMGGLVLTAKRDEADLWRKYARQTGREHQLLVFSVDSGLRFNFLEYAWKNEGGGAGMTENLVNLFCTVVEVSERKSGQSGGGSDAYWQRTLRQLLRNAIDLCTIATGSVDLESLHTIIYTAPSTPEIGALTDPTERLKASACLALIDQAAANPALSDIQRHNLGMTRKFWEYEYPALAAETRSIIVSTFTSMADCFLRGTLYQLFCTGLNVRPEQCWEEGKIIVIDLPVKEFYELGQFAQVLFKYLWQRAVERRIDIQGQSRDQQTTIRPVFLWADEAHFFANSYDAQFQSTARSSRACTVYLTQNVPSYQSVFGGSEGKAAADTFLGNLVTKIFHANGDATTNNWAAESIGKERTTFYQVGENSMTHSEQIAYCLEPRSFTMLRRGGDRAGVVDAVIFQSGRVWRNNKKDMNYIEYAFPQ